MIRYAISRAELEKLITAEKADWLMRAASRTEEFRIAGQYSEKSSIWSEIKSVYMVLQGNAKCAYCEREMESAAIGKIEQDVEHFRPKSNVRSWKAPQVLIDEGIVFTNPPAGRGYHLLPYNPLNYAAACKPCNTILKKDYFPVAGKYDFVNDDPAKLSPEKAYLIYPIGDLDEDPESLITFQGTSPRPASGAGFKRHRALVTIEFFKLDDPATRKALYRSRAIIIISLYSLLKKTRSGSAADRRKASQTVEGFLRTNLAHLNCAKSFKRLFETNEPDAEAMYDAAVQFVTSIS